MLNLKESLLALTVLASATATLATPVIVPNSSATALANAITGSGVTVLGATLTGAASQAGTFTNGTSSVGFASGVVLSTGNVNAIPGVNANTSAETIGSPTNGIGLGQISTNLNGAGYAPLGASTFDATVLTIRFQFGDGTVGGDVGVRYVFASEEYLGYIGSTFNDIFAFYLDGVNIALVPSTTQAVSVNTINPNTNSGSYINNVMNTNFLPVANRQFQFDGLTTQLVASKTGLGAGQHTMTFAIADVSDAVLDSAVFMQAGSFSTDTTDVPEPGMLALVSAALLGLGAGRRRASRG